MREILYGRNAVRECLRARRRHIHKVMMADNVESSAVIEEIVTLARKVKISVQRIPRQKLDNLARNHQGVALEVGRYPTVDLEDILDRAEKLNAPPFIIALDHIEDPHNLGAVIRTAEAAGFHGAIIPTRRAAPVTATVVRAAAGATAHLPLVFVGNLSQAIVKLKEQGIWVVGLEGEAELSIYKADLKGTLALVIGAEGKGIGHAVAKNCDFLVNIPLFGRVDSLNASVAFGVAAFEAVRQRRKL